VIGVRKGNASGERSALNKGSMVKFEQQQDYSVRFFSFEPVKR